MTLRPIEVRAEVGCADYPMRRFDQSSIAVCTLSEREVGEVDGAPEWCPIRTEGALIVMLHKAKEVAA